MVRRNQHSRFRELLAMTGLQQPVLIDRLLDLAFARTSELTAARPQTHDSGVRAAG